MRRAADAARHAPNVAVSTGEYPALALLPCFPVAPTCWPPSCKYRSFLSPALPQCRCRSPPLRHLCRSSYYLTCDLYAWNTITVSGGGWWQSVGVITIPRRVPDWVATRGRGLERGAGVHSCAVASPPSPYHSCPPAPSAMLTALLCICLPSAVHHHRQAPLVLPRLPPHRRGPQRRLRNLAASTAGLPAQSGTPPLPTQPAPTVAQLTASSYPCTVASKVACSRIHRWHTREWRHAVVVGKVMEESGHLRLGMVDLGN